MGGRDFFRDDFKPLTSGPALSSRPNYIEDFLRETAPQLFGNQVNTPESSGDFSTNPNSPNIVEIMRLTLPVPSPVAVTFTPWSDVAPLQTQTQFPAASTGFPAAAEFTTEERQQGRYILEWGLGKARANLFADFAPGSVQIPLAAYVTVKAAVYRLEDLEMENAGVVLTPGKLIEGATASFTTSIRSSTDTSETVARVPFAPEASFFFAQESTADDDYGAAQLRIHGEKVVPAAAGGGGGEAVSRIAQWIVPAVLQPNGTQIPYQSPSPVPGNVNRFTVSLEDLGAASGSYYAVGTVVQHIRTS